MDQRVSSVPQQARQFAPRDVSREEEDPTDEAGHALIAMVQQAAGLSNENYDRSKWIANKLAAELHGVKEHIKELEGVVSHSRDRAKHAEEWLERIKHEIEDKLLAPRPAPPR
jgi:hypothetical protein